LEGRNNAKAYKKILKNHLFRLREEMYAKGILDPLSKHDNSPVHTAKVITAFLDTVSMVWTLVITLPTLLISTPSSMFGLSSNAAYIKKYLDIIYMRGGSEAVKTSNMFGRDLK